MKIGIDIRTLMDAQYSGVSEYTLNLIKEILRLDSKNQYKLFYNSGQDVSQRIPKFRKENAEVISLRYPNKLFNYLLQKALAYPKIDQLLGVDLFFMPHINFISLAGRAKSILTIHDLSFLKYREFFSWRKNFWHSLINVKKLAKRFDKIITVSENTKDDIVKLLKVNPEKIEVIYSAISEQFRKVNYDNIRLAEVRQKYKLPNTYILFLGTLEPRKNVEGVIRAYNELREKNNILSKVKLIIAGGRGWKAKDIFRLWEKSKYRNDIQFLGYVKAEDRVYLYNLASLFVYPSFYEGFGFPPLEAMACGVPVVTSFASSLPEVTAKAALMVDPYNEAEITRAIEQILFNKELQDDLIKKGLEQARQFSWGKTAKEYLEVFKSIV